MSVRVSAMLLGSEQQALDIKAKLQAGGDFASLAKEFSQISNAKENGGDLGSISGNVSPAFDNFVFNPNVKAGTLSEPIRDDKQITRAGYWLIKVLEKADNRPVTDSDLGILKDKALTDWVSSLWIDPGNKIDDSYATSQKAWAELQAMKS